jgi:hypothetical protein
MRYATIAGIVVAGILALATPANAVSTQTACNTVKPWAAWHTAQDAATDTLGGTWCEGAYHPHGDPNWVWLYAVTEAYVPTWGRWARFRHDFNILGTDSSHRFYWTGYHSSWCWWGTWGC